MKKLLTTLLLIGIASSALALDKAELDHRARRLLLKFQAMQEKPDKRVPADVLKKARGIVLLDRTKAGFLFAYQGGTGIAMVKEKKSEKWGPIAFLKANEGSLGFQIGGQQAFYVILLMSDDSTRVLSESTFEVGGEARGTAGETSSGVDASVASTERPMLVYNERKGLFGGAAIKGGALSPDEDANLMYYEKVLTVKEILSDKKVKPTEVATDFAKKVTAYSAKK